MVRHVLFTGEIGAGKSTVLRRTLEKLDVEARGIETYSPEPRGVMPKRLFLRPYGSDEEGTLLCVLPAGDRQRITPAFDGRAADLLEAAGKTSDVIVIDEIGRLEREAFSYHACLKACFDGSKPVVGVIRKHKAPWADWIRMREDILLLEVTQENRDTLSEIAAGHIRAAIDKT